MAGNQGHRADWVSTYPFYWWDEEPAFAGASNGFDPAGDTVIGNDVWIGMEAIILPGVTVGDGAIIGARAVVAADVPAYAIVAGNPAHVIKRRFDDRTIERLQAIAWWNWPVEKIGDNLDAIRGADLARLEEVA